MNVVPLPAEPRKRRIIFVISRYEYERLHYEAWGASLLRDAMNGKVYMLIPSEVDEQNPIMNSLIQKGLDNEGMLLIQNPYDALDYAEIDKVLSVFSPSKWSHFLTFCDYLGVKNVDVEQVEISSFSGKELYKGGFELSSSKTNLELNSAIDRIQSDLIRIRRNLSSNERDFEAAEIYFSKHLSIDPFIKSLLTLRPKGSYELDFNLTQEVKRTLDVAAGLSLPQVPGTSIYADLKAKIDRSVRESYEFKLKLKVEF
jgi:hypothetical protein